ncbi:MAG TPA: hypothetical protein VGH33_02410 [Isosphaeraceae bacterium]|jgi:hypothetical protein
MTFAEWRATGRHVPDVRAAVDNDEPDDIGPVPGRVYDGGLYIEDARGMAGCPHRYFTIFAPDDGLWTDDLAHAERTVYDFGSDLGFLED